MSIQDWNGTFKEVSSENVEEFVTKIGAQRKAGTKVTESKLTSVYMVTDEGFCITQQRDGVENIMEGTFGNEFTFMTIDHLEMKGTIVMSDNNEFVGEFEGGFSLHCKLSDNGVMTKTFNCDDVTMTRTLQKM